MEWKCRGVAAEIWQLPLLGKEQSHREWIHHHLHCPPPPTEAKPSWVSWDTSDSWQRLVTGGSTRISQAWRLIASHLLLSASYSKTDNLVTEETPTSLGNSGHSQWRRHSPTNIPEVPVVQVKENKNLCYSNIYWKTKAFFYFHLLIYCWIVKRKIVPKEFSTAKAEKQSIEYYEYSG